MTPRSQELRDVLRTDGVVCYCPVEAKFEHGEHGHQPGCQWIAAVRAVYAEERCDVPTL